MLNQESLDNQLTTPCLNAVNCATWVQVLCWNSQLLWNTTDGGCRSRLRANEILYKSSRLSLAHISGGHSHPKLYHKFHIFVLSFISTYPVILLHNLGMDRARLLSRGFFHHPSNSSSNHTCPSVNESGPTIIPLVGSMSYHTLSSIIAGVCLVFTSALALISLMRHATHYSSPIQQRQILRIICLIPWVGLISFLSVLSESVGPYIAPAIDVGVSLAISAFLLLLCDFVLAGPDGFDDLFGAGATSRGQFNMQSPKWLKRVWYLVLQFIPVSVILWIATATSMAAGTYCATSNKLYFAHIWVRRKCSSRNNRYWFSIADYCNSRFPGRCCSLQRSSLLQNHEVKVDSTRGYAEVGCV